MFFNNFYKLLVINSFFGFLNPRWWSYCVATWMSPLGGGTGRTPRLWAKTKHCFVCSARFGIPYAKVFKLWM